MKKSIGWLLILLAILVIFSMIINNHTLWFIVDILVILGCLLAGIYLLVGKRQ